MDDIRGFALDVVATTNTLRLRYIRLREGAETSWVIKVLQVFHSWCYTVSQRHV